MKKYSYFLIIIYSCLFFSCGKDDVADPKTSVQKWYLDADQDGFGNKNKVKEASTQPQGYVANADDCNDYDTNINPNAQEKPDGIDNNCDGEISKCTSNADCDGVCINDVCTETTEFSKLNFTHNLTNTLIPYHFFKPKQSLKTTEKFPLIIALHGLEYFGSDKDFFLKQPHAETLGYFALGWIKEEVQNQYPSFVVAPNIHKAIHHPLYSNEWSDNNGIDLINSLLNKLIEEHSNIDINRIYLTGHSAGGGGTWVVGTALKDRIAALVPLSSALGYSTEQLSKEINNGSFANLPVWSFIHTQDLGLKSRILFDKLKERGYEITYTHAFGTEQYNLTSAQIEAKIDKGVNYFYTQYSYPCSSDCHFAMTHAIKEPLLFKWLFKQKKN